MAGCPSSLPSSARAAPSSPTRNFATNLLADLNQFSRSGKAKKEAWDRFSPHIYYQVSDVKTPAAYEEFGQRIAAFEQEWNTPANVIYYLAVAPEFFPIIATGIAKSHTENDPSAGAHRD